MYTVEMQEACACFKKSEYSRENTFQTQQDAYNYATIITELMNEEFCSKHIFSAQKTEDDNFLIKVVVAPVLPSNYNPHISCDTGCGSTDNWSLESTDIMKDNCHND
jgi:hypothetical protein